MKLHIPCVAGRFLIERCNQRNMTRRALAESLGIGNRFMWEVIYGYRPLPIARLELLRSALSLSQEELDVFQLATAQDRLSRSKRKRDFPLNIAAQ